MKKIQVLITDDSALFRTHMRFALNKMPFVEIVGTAANGKVALDFLSKTKVDLLILDLEMPEMNGIETLKQMMDQGMKTKVLVFSSISRRGAEITLDALRLGASDFITKPGAQDESQEKTPADKIHSLLEPKILALFPQYDVKKPVIPAPFLQKYKSPIWSVFNPKVIVIGSSTGGPTALEKIFSQLAPPLKCPILITQHVPPVFSAMLAERIQKASGITCYEAKHSQLIENAIYLAPGNFHMKVVNSLDGPRISIDQGPHVNSVRPAVDHLFTTAANVYKDRCLGIVLTGMGADGKVGSEDIKKEGGAMIIQSEETCVVFGMPGAVYAAGTYDYIMSPDEIAKVLQEKGTDKNVQRMTS